MRTTGQLRETVTAAPINIRETGVHRRRFSGRKVEKIMSYDYLLTIAIILLSTKVFGLTSERVHMPQVVGALIAGVLVGPSVLNWVGETDFLVKAAELG